MGYGVFSYNLWKELTKITDLTLWPIGNQVSVPTSPEPSVVDSIKKDIAKQENFNFQAPCLKVWHENHLAERIGSGPYSAYPFFEVSKFDNRRKSHLLSVDNIIVSSQWAKNIVERNINKDNVSVVPCGVDTSIFAPSRNEYNKCVFMNCGKWEYRKGHDVLGNAFKKAFSNNEDVELWMMCDNPFLSPEEKAEWESLYRAPNIKIIPRVKFHEQVADIMKSAYCGVFPSRAEGWNLEALEMLSMGKHLIITDYSAHTEFCTSDNSLLLNIDNEEAMYDGKWFTGDNGVWADIDEKVEDQLINYMRGVYGLWLEDSQKINSQGISTARELSWEKCANSIKEIVLGE